MSGFRDDSNAFLDIALPMLMLLTGSCMVLAFTPEKSAVRLAWLPVITFLARSIVNNSSTYFRRNHGRLVGSFAAGMVMHWIDVALVSKWSYHDAKQDSQERRMTQQRRDSWKQRLRWGMEALFESRRLNMQDEAKNVPSLSNWAARSRANFLVYASAKLIICYLLADILTPHPPTPAETSQKIYALRNIPIFARLWQSQPIDLHELSFRVFFTFSFWLLTYSMMTLVMTTVAILTVGSGLHKPQDWKPFFGNIASAANLRGFWGKFWHQGFRHPFSNPADWVVEKVLQAVPSTIKPSYRRWLARYSKVFCTFALSGTFHVAGDIAAKGDVKDHQTMAFFLTQAAGIMLEDHVRDLYYSLRGRSRDEASLLERFVGYIWVALFLVWTTPQWMFPSLVANTAETKPFLPFSIIEYATARTQAAG